MTDYQGERFPEADRRLPAGWRRVERGFWSQLEPPEQVAPAQGWKIHVSATAANARQVLDWVWRHCVKARVAFAFVVGPSTLFALNAKGAAAGAGGSLATIYPADEEQLELTLTELGGLLAEQAGPHVPGSLRWREGPLHLRYGGFAPRYAWDARDRRIPVIRDPGGALVRDGHEAAFDVPDWAPIPAFLRPLMAAMDDGDVIGELPYQVEETLRRSNGGGVFRATDPRAGRVVVIKEARPHTGWDVSGADAVARLRRERAMLERLAGLRCVPELLDSFAVGGHEFLVLEHVPGRSLHAWQAMRNPLLFPTGAVGRADAYTAWAIRTHTTLRAAVARIHGRGVVLGDLHPRNVLVDEHGAVHLVDFEMARPVDEARSPVGAVGFVAPPGREGFDVDEYALAAIRVALFLPLTAMTAFAPGRAQTLVEGITSHFPAPAHFFAKAARTLAPSPRPAAWAGGPGGAAWARASATIHDLAHGAASWTALRDGLVQGILHAATPGRPDRLFPGSPAQFAPGGGLNLATGAAGVLYALNAAGARPSAEHADWLARTADQTPDLPAGLYDGLHGVSHVLRLLGRRHDADRLLERALDQPASSLPTGVFHAVAGIGLHLIDLAAHTGDPAAYQAAESAVTHTADRLADADRDLDHPGLLRGWAGPALLFLRWRQLTGDAATLPLARAALRRDLQRCQTTPDGRLHASARPGHVPCLDNAGGGVGLVLDEYLAVSPDEQFAAAREAAIRTACAPFFAHPSLLRGRAGMLLYLTRQHRPTLAKAVAAHLRRLAWHLVPCRGGLAVPGPALARLSTDLAFGSAGVLLAVARAHGLTAADLPLLTQSRSHGRRRLALTAATGGYSAGCSATSAV